MQQTGLVLEGGGMRGVYTAGVLDYFLEKQLYFLQIYGVSAGSLTGANYMSRQKGRSLATLTDYVKDERYCGISNLVKTGDFFNVDFVYNQIPNHLNPFDYQTFKQNPATFQVVLSNIVTGKPEYITCRDMKTDMVYLRASSSLPLCAKIVTINGKKYLDGGICDSIPLRKSYQDNNKKNVVILTQHKGYIKQPNNQMPLVKYTYRRYPNFIKAMEHRHLMYNNETEFVNKEAEKGNIFVIQPKEPVTLKRLEKDTEKMQRLYLQGYYDAMQAFPALLDYLQKE